MRRPNLRFLAVSAIVALAVTLTAHIVHGLQTNRTSKVLLIQARQLREKGDLGNAVGYYQRYVQFAPSDTAALAEYGLTLAGLPTAQSSAILVLDQVLRRDPAAPGCRRRLVDLAVETGRFRDAKAHLLGPEPEAKQKLKGGLPLDIHCLFHQHEQDGELWNLLGQCEEAQGDTAAALESYGRAVQYSPDRWQAFVRRALLYDRNGQKDEADKAINDMVQQNPNSADAYFARGQYWMKGQQNEKALADAERALSLNDTNMNCCLFAALAAQNAGNLDKAVMYVEKARLISAKEPRVYSAAARLAIIKSDPDRAIELLKQGLLAKSNDIDLLWALGFLQINRGDLAAAKKTIMDLGQISSDGRACAKYLEGRILLQQGDVIPHDDQPGAITYFEELRPQLLERPRLRQLNDFSLGVCYDRVGYLDQRIAAYRRALQQDARESGPAAIVNDDSERQPARLGLAAALASAGRIDEAIDNYQQVISALKSAGMSSQQSPRLLSDSLQELARLYVLQQLRYPTEQRSWQRPNDALKEAAAAAPDSANLVILKAEILLAQDETEEARELLAKYCSEQPGGMKLWIARSALDFRLGKYESARKWLNDAEAKLGDSADIRLERIRQALSSTREAALDEVSRLAKEWDVYPREEQFALTRQTASVYSVLGDNENAERYWTKAIALRPEWLPSYLFLFDAASQRKDDARLAELLDKIQRIEGREKGPLWCYGEAVRQLILAANDKSHLTVARKLLAEAILQRPRWARAYALLAEIEKQDGNLAAATERYESAVDMGERSPSMIRNLVVLLFQRRRFSEADKVLRKLEEQQAPFSTDLNRLASEVSWRVEDYGRALELAQKAAEESTKLDDHLWLGQLLTLLRRPNDAERALCKGTELAPEEPRAWLALAYHWISLRSPDNMEVTLQRAAEHLSAAQHAIVRAQSLTALANAQRARAELASARGDAEAAARDFSGAQQNFDRAAQAYRHAMEVKPDDSKALASAVEFFLFVQSYSEAEPLLRRQLQPDVASSSEEQIVARRQLALVLANGGEFARVQEALTLIEQNSTTGQTLTEEDQRVKAVVLSELPDRRKDAIALFESLVQIDSPKPNDRLLLAKLYEADGRWPEARRLLQSLIASEQSQGIGQASEKLAQLHRAIYVRALLNHFANAPRNGKPAADLQEASIWIEKLAPVDPQTIELRAFYDTLSGRIDQAVKAVQLNSQSLENSGERGRSASLLADLATKTNDPAAAKLLNDAAESLFRDLIRENPRQTPALASFLARQGRFAEAIDRSMAWAESSENPDPRDAVIATVAAACQMKASPLDRTRVEQWLVTHADQWKGRMPLDTALATLYEAQGRFDEAINSYRRALRQNAKDVVALNNLALLLAYRKDTTEALQMLEQAFEIAGTRPELLDSRGTVRLEMGEVDRARADFKAAIQIKASPSRWLHLAFAENAAHHDKECNEAHERAQDLGLEPASISPFEVTRYRALLTKIQQSAKLPKL